MNFFNIFDRRRENLSIKAANHWKLEQSTRLLLKATGIGYRNKGENKSAGFENGSNLLCYNRIGAAQ